MKEEKILNITKIGATVLLFLAIGRQPYSYYIFLRYSICIISIFASYYVIKKESFFWLIFFIVVAIVFNPIAPVHLRRQIWLWIDVGAAFGFLISIPLLGSKNYMQKQSKKSKRDRESELWENPLAIEELNEVRKYLISKLSKMQATDWGDYALRAICTNSPTLSKLMIGSDLNVEFIRESEMEGVIDTIKVIMHIRIEEGITLRDMFHQIFTEIYKHTKYASKNKFYWFGRDRVIEMLRSYKASTKTFVPHSQKFYDSDGSEFKLDRKINTDIIKKVKEALDFTEESINRYAEIQKTKEQYRFPIESEFPVIEFDLEAISKMGIFQYSGSLVNSLFLEIRNLLSLSADYTFLESRISSQELFDAIAMSFSFEDGVVVLVKYKAAVEYFPDRLYVELQNIELDSSAARWLKSYKMHLEGND